MDHQTITVSLTQVYSEKRTAEYTMGSTNYSHRQEAIQKKSTGGAECLEKTSSTDISDTMVAGFDGLSDNECKALEKRRMYLTSSSPSFG